MIRLLTIALVVAAIQAQVASEPQGPVTWTCSCNNGNQSPWSSPLSPKYQSLVANGPPVATPGVNPPYVPCACGGYPGPAPPGLPVAPGPYVPPGLPVAPGPYVPPGLPVAPGPYVPPGLPVAPGPSVLSGLPVAPGSPAFPGLPIAPGSPLPYGMPVEPSPFLVPGPPCPPLPPAPISFPGPPALPSPTGPAGFSPNSLVVFSQGPLPQNAPTFVQSSGPLTFPGAPLGPPAPPVNNPSSHIMNIPKKETPVSFTFTNSSPIPEAIVPSNSIYSTPIGPPPPGPAPSPLYYTQPASLVSSCPATVVYPATQPQFAPPQNAILPYPPPKNTFVPPSPPLISGPNYSQPISIPTFVAPPAPVPIAPSSSPSIPVPIAPAGPSPPKIIPSGPTGFQSKSPLTYTLLGANKSSLPGSSLEAENNDCAMPVPPPLLKTN